MAVVLAGMTLSQIVSLIASLAAAAKDIQSIHDELKSAGHPADALIPVDKEIAVRQAMSAAQAQIDWDADHSN
jgi:hypothetical protein